MKISQLISVMDYLTESSGETVTAYDTSGPEPVELTLGNLESRDIDHEFTNLRIEAGENTVDYHNRHEQFGHYLAERE